MKWIIPSVCFLFFSGSAFSEEGVRRIQFLNYENCVELSNKDTVVVLCHQVGGRVIKYARNGENALYLDPAESLWKRGSNRKPSSAGRFDIGPEYLIPRHQELWSGEWTAEVTGPRAARLTSKKDEATGVQLIRDFQLAADSSHLECKQTIVNISKSTKRWCHWSRTFAPHGGIGLVPLTSGQSKFPNQYIMMEQRNLANIAPEDPMVRNRDGFLEVLGPPKHPKLGMDSLAGWFGYQMPCDLLFVKSYRTYPGRLYNEVLGLTISIWYPQKDKVPACELEPIGPATKLEPGERESFSEHWHLLDHPFPKKGQQLDLKAVGAKVEKALQGVPIGPKE